MITYNVEYSYEMKLKKKTLKVNMAFIEVFFFTIFHNLLGYMHVTLNIR